MQERENLATLNAVEARFATISRWIGPEERKLLTIVWTSSAETLFQYVLGSDRPLALAALGELTDREKAQKFRRFPKPPFDPKRFNEVLAQCLTSTTHADVRESAALILAEHNDPRAIPILRNLLIPESKRTLHEGAAPLRAAFLLARFQDTVSYPKMRQLGGQLDDPTKRHFADLLCLMGDPASVAQLGGLLKSSYQGTRSHAAIAIGKRKARRFVPELTALLSDKYATVRRDAAWALAAIGDKKAIPALQRALTKTYETVEAKNTRLKLAQTNFSVAQKTKMLHSSVTRDGLMIQAALDTLKKGQAVEIARNPLGDTLRQDRF